MKKIFAGLLLVCISTLTAFAADTTYSTRGQKKVKKTKLPVNLYVPEISPVGAQSIQGMSGQQFLPQVDLQSGGSAGVRINSPYFERREEASSAYENDAFSPNSPASETYVNPYEQP